MRLDISNMRYLSKNDWRVLCAMEIGMKTHDLVPTSLIISLSGLQNASCVQRCISTLAKTSLITRVRNASYDGYRLTYRGYDYIALKSFLQKKTLYALGNQVGVGKESDIYAAVDEQGRPCCLKIHRLGRTSFRNVKNTRNYLGKRISASWQQLSQLAAKKEFEFMTLLYDHAFSVPKPIDLSYHHVLMSLIDDSTLLVKIREHPDPGRLYSTLMNFILRLANHGLIHCDFNEFNILVRNSFDLTEPEHEVVVIDFPQCVSIDHPNARDYFERDVGCIRHFFESKFSFVGNYPDWSDVNRIKHLDIQSKASGSDRKLYAELENHTKAACSLEGRKNPDSPLNPEDLS